VLAWDLDSTDIKAGHAVPGRRRCPGGRTRGGGGFRGMTTRVGRRRGTWGDRGGAAGGVGPPAAQTKAGRRPLAVARAVPATWPPIQGRERMELLLAFRLFFGVVFLSLSSVAAGAYAGSRKSWC
jgi:hypothetical protein